MYPLTRRIAGMKNQRGRKNQNGSDQAKYWNENPSLNARTIK